MAGTYRGLAAEELEIGNPLFHVHTEAVVSGGADDTHDIGFFGQYWDGAATLYTGLFRDASDGGKYKMFDGLTTLPTVDTGVVADVSASLAGLDVQDLGVFGDAIITGNLTVNGSTFSINVETLVVEDNIIIANSGPLNQKQDAGFVVNRSYVGIVQDTPTTFGTIDNNGTSTTQFTLDIGAHIGLPVDYYKGWVIEINGTDVSTIVSSNTADPIQLIVDPPLLAIPQDADLYNLYNKRLVGTIYDESEKQLALYQFPREDKEVTISTGSITGNLAEYANLRLNNLRLNNITIDGTINGLAGPTSIVKTAGVATTLTNSEVSNNAIIYLDPTVGSVTFTLPTIASLGLAAGEFRAVLFVNITTNTAIVAGNGAETIEGNASFSLKRQWWKFTLVSSPDQSATTWIIE